MCPQFRKNWAHCAKSENCGTFIFVNAGSAARHRQGILGGARFDVPLHLMAHEVADAGEAVDAVEGRLVGQDAATRQLVHVACTSCV